MLLSHLELPARVRHSSKGKRLTQVHSPKALQSGGINEGWRGAEIKAHLTQGQNHKASILFGFIIYLCLLVLAHTVSIAFDRKTHLVLIKERQVHTVPLCNPTHV